MLTLMAIVAAVDVIAIALLCAASDAEHHAARLTNNDP